MYGKVSIIMPNYNCDKFIEESIKSVLSQTYENWELLIVDDCSTDKSVEIVKKYCEIDNRIKLFINDKNSGAALSRNKAMREATGKWIAFLDSDDLWKPTKLEKQLTFMKENDYDFSYTEYEKIDEKSNSLKVLVTGPKKITKQGMYNYGWMGCLTVIYDAEKIGLIQIKDIKKNNDYAIWLQVAKKSKCYLLPENLALYRIRKKSISHDKFSKKLKSHYDLFHYCDEKSALCSVWFACWNMFFGVIKKMKYERRFE